MKTEFKEEQKFTQWWIWIILTGIGLLPIYGIYNQLIMGNKSGSKQMSDLGLLFFALFVFGIIALFWLMRLKTEINKNELKINFFPFVKKKIKWNDIKSVKIVNYGFVGGWGIRLWTKYGTVYNIKGETGLAVELNNGNRFLIGTQKETELNSILNTIKPELNVAFPF